jgi:hypothetical protein
MRDVLLIEGVGVVADGLVGIVDRGNERQQVEGAGIGLVGEHPPAANHIAGLWRSGAIEAAAEIRSFLVDGDVAAGDAAVADQIRRAGERGDAAADEMRLGVAPRCGSIGKS